MHLETIVALKIYLPTLTTMYVLHHHHYAHTVGFNNTVVAIAQQYKLHVIFAINVAITALFVVKG
jgi:hypothetical protein